MPDCWLEVSLHLEGPATGQLDQGFPWFSSLLEQMLSWYPNSTLLWSLHIQHSQCWCWCYIKVSSYCSPPTLVQNFTLMQPFQRDIKINSHHTQSKIPVQLFFSGFIPIRFLKLHPLGHTSIRRTSEHCLGTFKSGDLKTKNISCPSKV
jgi:hypothetical protein